MAQDSSKFFRFFEDMPPVARGILIVGGVGLSAYIVITIVNSVKKKQQQAVQNAPAQQALNDLATLRQNGVVPSYIQSDYNTMADSLQYAMGGCTVDWNTITSIFQKMQNTADVQMLITAWGTRSVAPCAINPYDTSNGTIPWIENLFGFGGTQAISLPTAIQEADQYASSTFSGGSSGFLGRINGILKTNNVNYQF